MNYRKYMYVTNTDGHVWLLCQILRTIYIYIYIWLFWIAWAGTDPNLCMDLWEI